MTKGQIAGVVFGSILGATVAVAVVAFGMIQIALLGFVLVLLFAR